MKAILVLWALAATALAAAGWMREPEEAPARTSRASVQTRTEVRILEKRVKQLESVLAGTLRSEPQAEAQPEGIRDLVEKVVALEEGEDWNQEEFGRLHRAILRLIMSDAESHRDLVRLLDADPARAHEVTSQLLSPFAKLTSNTHVTAEIRETATRLMVEGTPEQRSAAARILLGYESPRREDVLHALIRLQEEPDPGVREDILLAISDFGDGVGLSVEEAEPFLQTLREQLRAGEDWCGVALADWSASDEDFDLIKAEFLNSTDDDFRKFLLNALAPETRMAGSRYEEARAFLLDIVVDDSYSDDLRDWALDARAHARTERDRARETGAAESAVSRGPVVQRPRNVGVRFSRNAASASSATHS